jgi:hypothetical protein
MKRSNTTIRTLATRVIRLLPGTAAEVLPCFIVPTTLRAGKLPVDFNGRPSGAYNEALALAGRVLAVG